MFVVQKSIPPWNTCWRKAKKQVPHQYHQSHHLPCGNAFHMGVAQGSCPTCTTFMRPTEFRFPKSRPTPPLHRRLALQVCCVSLCMWYRWCGRVAWCAAIWAESLIKAELPMMQSKRVWTTISTSYKRQGRRQTTRLDGSNPFPDATNGTAIGLPISWGG